MWKPQESSPGCQISSISSGRKWSDSRPGQITLTLSSSQLILLHQLLLWRVKPTFWQLTRRLGKWKPMYAQRCHPIQVTVRINMELKTNCKTEHGKKRSFWLEICVKAWKTWLEFDLKGCEGHHCFKLCKWTLCFNSADMHYSGFHLTLVGLFGWPLSHTLHKLINSLKLNSTSIFVPHFSHCAETSFIW